jgi:MFS family permease
VIFAIASAFCGMAANIEQLIVARSVQGIGGALLVPGSLALISSSFRKRARQSDRHVVRFFCDHDSDRTSAWRLAGRALVLARSFFLNCRWRSPCW